MYIQNHAVEPQIQKVTFIVEQDLYGNLGSVKTTLHSLYASNASGINGKPVHTSFEPVVKYSKDLSLFSHNILTGNENEIHIVASDLCELANQLERMKKSPETVKRARELARTLKETPHIVQLWNIYQLLLDAWHIVGSMQFTYRILANTIDLEYILPNSETEKKALLRLIYKMAADW